MTTNLQVENLLYLRPRNMGNLVGYLIAILINIPRIKYRFVLWVKSYHC